MSSTAITPTSISKKRRKTGKTGLSFTSILTHMLVGIGGIYIGLIMGMHTCSETATATTTVAVDGGTETLPETLLIPKEQERLPVLQERRQQQQQKLEALGGDFQTSYKSDDKKRIKFPQKISKYMVDYATVSRDEFNKKIEIGVPMDDTKPGEEEVLILYTDEKTLPFKNGSREEEKEFGPKDSIDTKIALQNCHTVKVILQEPSKRKNGKRQCIAIVPQWESWHIHKFMRLPKDKDIEYDTRVDVKHPLRYVSRSMSDKGAINKFPELRRDTLPSYDGLVEYLTNLDRILNELKPILKQALLKSNDGVNKNEREIEEGVTTTTTPVVVSNAMKKSKSIVVMVCNKGQAHLFQNFVCNARSRGLDLSRIIMFATDKYTVKLCHDLNIAVYYDEIIFGDMPEMAARRYGDKIFSQMMMAKVYCVHLVMSLGYDVLFQDVDVIWHRHPLEYLVTEESKEWDMMFQDDGSRQPRYNPYSPNTGFYFVRNNPLTMYLFSSLLRAGDLISATKSHQAALSALLAEFTSWKGLRVKVWRKGGVNLFPGGVEYHLFKDYMKKFFANEIKPYIFHMSWTQNKDNKKLYYEQMGEWYTKEDNSCSGFDCCLPQPNIICHFRDKPSKKPCNDSPPIDKGKPSWWK